MTDPSDPAIEFIQSTISSLKSGGPDVDHFVLGLYCMRELPIRRSRQIRSLVVTYRDWHDAWLEDCLVLRESEDSDNMASMMAALHNRLEASDNQMPIPGSFQRECIEAVVSSDDRSVSGIASAVRASYMETGDDPPAMVKMLLELQNLSTEGFVKELVVDEKKASGARKSSGQSMGYELGQAAEDLYCSVCRPFLSKRDCDRDSLLAIDELTTALALPRGWMTAFLRLTRK